MKESLFIILSILVIGMLVLIAGWLLIYADETQATLAGITALVISVIGHYNWPNNPTGRT